MSLRRSPPRSPWCGVILSLVCLEAVVAGAYVLRNSAEFSLLRLGVALQDHDAQSAARYLTPEALVADDDVEAVGWIDDAAAVVGGDGRADLFPSVSDGIAHGYSLQIGPWRAFPDERAVGSLQTARTAGLLELRGSCRGKAVSVDVRLRRVDAGHADLLVVDLPVYDWRIVGVSPASICHVVDECSADAARPLRCGSSSLLSG